MRDEPYRPAVGCQATRPATGDDRCTEWVADMERAGRVVAGGGAIPGRVATAGPLAARSVGGRAEESFAGTHRCGIFDVVHTDRHQCGCGFRWDRD